MTGFPLPEGTACVIPTGYLSAAHGSKAGPDGGSAPAASARTACADFSLPFGGFKQSGVGREGGLAGLMGYTEMKTVLLDAMPAGALA